MARDSDAASRIKAAATQLLVDGDGDFEMSAVAKAAGVSTGLAYHHFGSKAGLLCALITEFYDRYNAVTNTRFEQGMNWHVREKERLKLTVDFCFSDPFAEVVFGKLSGSPDVTAIDAERRRVLINLGAENFRRAQAKGHVDPHLNPVLASTVVMGGLLQAMADAFSMSPRPDREELTEELWKIVSRIAPPPK